MKALLLATASLLGGTLVAVPAHALDPALSGTWAVVSPPSQDMLGARLRFSNRTKNSVFVQINQMSGTLRESDGNAGSNYVVRTEAFDCYYLVSILTEREEMTWQLVRSGGSNCVPTFAVRSVYRLQSPWATPLSGEGK
jgi:hypothetical protein